MSRKTHGPEKPLNETPLRICLLVAVPMWIERLRHEPREAIERRAMECGIIIGSTGDLLQSARKTKKDTAKSFNNLAQGIACAALCVSGGVDWPDIIDELFREPAPITSPWPTRPTW